MNWRRLPHPATFLPWLVTAFSLLWLKRDLLIAFPLVPMRGGAANSGFLADIACFRIDIALLFGVIPLVLSLIFYFLPRSWHLPLLATVCALLEVVVYGEGRSLLMVGQFVSLSLFLSAISWGTSGSETMNYLPISGLIKLIVAIGVVLLCAFLAHGLARGNSAQNSKLRKRIVAGYLGITVLASVACWVIPVRATPMTSSIASILVKSFFGVDADTDRTKGLRSASMDELIASYRRLTQAPVSSKDPRYWGKAKGENVIFFILETAPARDLDVAGDLSDCPNLARLREHSLVGEMHHSTYSYTNRAYISIFTSLYPTARKNFQSFPDRALPGVISSLRGAGYQTGIYGHLWTGETDANMFKSIGFDTIGVPPGGLDSGDVPWKEKIVIDRSALQLLETDVQKMHSSGKRFAFAFTPNVGHGPWPDMSGDGDRESVAERGRALMRLEDAWLGELLQVLEKNDILSNTIIVVTGDHGIRDKTEDPTFVPGMIDEYSFHVPLLVYSQAAIPKRVDIPWITSHIDITPTVLDLVGIDSGRTMEEGAPIWQENLRDRTTFFLSSHYLGSDGYYRNQKYYMTKYLSNAAYESSELHFGKLRLSGAAADEVEGMTTELNAIQSAIFFKFAFDKQESSHN